MKQKIPIKIPITQCTSANTALVIVDFQDAFRKAIPAFNEVMQNTIKLAKAAQLLDIPLLVTRQNPNGLGDAAEELKPFVTEPIDKTSFDCFADAVFCDRIAKLQCTNLIICGLESHICVFQTALSGIHKGMVVHVAGDAIASRRQTDHDIALQRMCMEGVHLASVEMLLFHLMKDAKHPMFKQLHAIIAES